MIPLRLIIEGIGPHESTEIDFRTMGPLVAITAPCGVGKTWMLESLFFALHGEFGYYVGSPYDAMTQGGIGRARVAVAFEQDGRQYEIERILSNTGKTQTHKATVYDFESGEMLAGPKVSDADRLLSSLLGDAETALATWFMSQNRRFDLIGDPGETGLVDRRRRVFASLVNAAKLDTLETKYSDKARECNAVVAELEAQLRGEPDYQDAIAKAQQELEEIQTKMTQTSSELKMKEQAEMVEREAVLALKGSTESLERTIVEHDRKYARLMEVSGEMERAQFQVEKLTAMADVDRAQREVAQLDQFQRDIADLEYNQEQYEEFRAWKDKRAAKDAEIQSLVSTRTALASASEITDETRALAETKDEALSNFNEAVGRNRVIEEENKKRDEQRHDLKTSLAFSKRQLEEIKNRLASKPETPGGEICETCPLLKDFQGLEFRVPELEHEIAYMESNLSFIPENRPLIDLVPLSKAVQDRDHATEIIAKAKKALQAIDDLDGKIARCKTDLAGFDLNKPEFAQDRSSDLRMLRTEVRKYEGAREHLAQAQKAAEDLKEAKAYFNTIKEKHAKAESECNDAYKDAKEAQEILNKRHADLEAVETVLRKLSNEAAQLRETLEDLRNESAKRSAQIEQYKAMIEAYEAKRKRLAAVSDEGEGYYDLRQCFGPRGVRQILIDHAAPELEDLADALFNRATDGRFRLRLATQSLNKDGSLREDFSIMVRDHRGERDAVRFSGGEGQLIRIILRIAVALWVGKIHGRRPEVLILDETFDRLGQDETESLISILTALTGNVSGDDPLAQTLGSMGGGVKRLLVVTHNPLIASRLPAQITLRRFGSAGVSVETA